MNELARKYYENYTNEYMSKDFIKRNKLQDLSTEDMYQFLRSLIKTASDSAMRAQAEADYRVYND